jgi:hypothetical protein
MLAQTVLSEALLPQTPGWWQTLTALARKVGNYIPVLCGAGAFDYYGGRVSGSVASVGVYKINAADTRDGVSHGVFTDITVGEAVQGGYGYASYRGGSTEHFLFGGVGGNFFGFGLSGGLYGSHIAGDSIFRNQIGINGDVGVPGVAAGGGAGMNTDSLTSCADNNFH